MTDGLFSLVSATSSLSYEMIGGNNIDNVGANNLLVTHESGGKTTRIMIDRGVMFGSGHNDSGAPKTIDSIMTNCDDLYGKIDALVITHAHMDHIGAISYDVLRGKKLPEIYCTPFTQASIEADMMKKEIEPSRWPKFNRLPINQDVTIGDMTVTAFPVSHSIPEACGLIIGSSNGVIVHSGDFKTDQTVPVGPVYNQNETDKQIKRVLKNWGHDQVALLAVDSTRSATPGFTKPEKEVGETLRQIVDENSNNRIVISAFSTHISRISQLAGIAADTGRTLVVHGASMEWSLKSLGRTAAHYKKQGENAPWLDQPLSSVLPNQKNHGYSHVEALLSAMNGGKKVKILSGDDGALKRIPLHKQLVLCTGTQGEPDSSLTRAAKGSHNLLQLGPRDVVIISGSVIPGNEGPIETVRDSIRSQNVNALITVDDRLVHTSGHGRQEDIRLLVTASNPANILPIHGDTGLLRDHQDTLQQNFGTQANILAATGNGHKIVLRPGQPIAIEPAQTPEFIGVITQKTQTNKFYYTYEACDEQGKPVKQPDAPGLKRPVARIVAQ